MSRRQTRPPGATKLRRDTARKRIAEQSWKDAAAEGKAYAAAVTARTVAFVREHIPDAVEGKLPAPGIATDLYAMAHLYGDPLLQAAAERLEAYGLAGDDWRKVAEADRGMWADYTTGMIVTAIEDHLGRGVALEDALERAIIAHPVPSLSHDGAVQWAKRAYLRWRDAGPEERFPAAGKRRPRA